MYKFFKHFLAIPILFGFYSAKAQSDNTLGHWEIFVLKGNISNKFFFIGEFNARANDFSSIHNYCEYKLSMGYYLKKNLGIALGTGGYNTSLTGSFLSTLPSQKEVRIWLDMLLKHSFSRFYLDHRVRLERRFTSLGNTTRLRYRIAVSVPIFKPELNNNTIYATVNNEIFLGQGHPTYEKNRLFLGAGYKLNDNLNFQLGNLNQTDLKGSYSLSKNFLQLTIIYSLTKKIAPTFE